MGFIPTTPHEKRNSTLLFNGFIKKPQKRLPIVQTSTNRTLALGHHLPVSCKATLLWATVTSVVTGGTSSTVSSNLAVSICE
jgi:hypothetical protein